jgi:hypothetical protein
MNQFIPRLKNKVVLMPGNADLLKLNQYVNYVTSVYNCVNYIGESDLILAELNLFHLG